MVGVNLLRIFKQGAALHVPCEPKMYLYVHSLTYITLTHLYLTLQK